MNTAAEWNRESLTAVLAALDQAVLLCRPDGLVQHANESANALGEQFWPGRLWEGHRIDQHFVESDRVRVAECLVGAAMGRPGQCEVEMADRQSSRRTLLLQWRPVSPQSAQITGVCVSIVDLTPRQTAEHTLGVLRRALDAIGEGVMVADSGWRPIFYNRAFERLSAASGGSEVSLGALLSAGGIARDHRGTPEVMPPVHQVLEGTDPGGGHYWHEISVVPLLDDSGAVTHYVGVREDVTKRKQMEHSLEESRSRLQAVITTALDGIISFDEGQRIVLINRSAAAMFQWGEEAALGRAITDLIPLLRNGKKDTIDRVDGAAGAGTAARPGELQAVRSNGETFPVEVSLSQVQVHGRQLHTVIVRDITERRYLQEQLLRQQRLDSVGRLASGLAHDLNNILTPILMVPGMLRGRTQDPVALNLLDLLEQGARRGAAIIEQLLTFAREMPGERKILHPGVLAESAARIIRETFPKNIDLDLRVEGQPWALVGDATQVQQLILNLALNGRDAMLAGGRLTILVANEMITPAAARATPGAKPGPHVSISVIDTGHGIAPEHMERIFDPFFSTKGLGEGSGLGLSAALGIARKHGGFMTVRSRPRAGATFRVCLPAVGVDQGAAPGEAGSSGRADGVILVVDDEEHLRLITRQLLVQHGYTVICARDGETALSHFKSAAHGIDLVLTDLAMPGMGGERLIGRLRRQDPALPIVVMTGHDPAQTIDAGRVQVDAVLRKPFSGAELLQALARARRAETPESGPREGRRA